MSKVSDKIKNNNELNLYKEMAVISRELEQEFGSTEQGQHYLELYKKLLDSFHTNLNKNEELINIISKNGNQLLENAQKLKDISSQAAYDKDEMISLNQEFERVVKLMEEAQRKSNSTAVTIHSYQEEIDFCLEQQNKYIAEDKERNDMQLENDSIRDEIGRNEVEIDTLKGELEDAKLKLKIKEKELCDAQGTLELVEGEYSESEDLHKSIKQGNADQVTQMIDTQEQIEKYTVELEEVTEKVKNYVIDPRLKEQLTLLQLELKSARAENEKKNAIVELKKKALNAAKKNSDGTSSYIKKVSDKIAHYNDTLPSLNEDLKKQLDIRKELEPVYNEVKGKWDRIKDEKTSVSRANSDSIKKVVELGFENLKVTNDINLNTRKVQTSDMQINQLKKDIQSSEHEMKEMKNIQQIVNSETMIIRQKHQKMMENAAVILAESEQKQNERSLTQIKTRGVLSEVTSMKEQNEAALDVLKDIKKQTEKQSLLVDRIRQERNTLKNQAESARAETEILRLQYKDLIESIRVMTQRLDHIMLITQKEHEAAKVIKESNVYIANMNEQCAIGLKMSEQASNELVSNKTSLKSLLDKSESDYRQQKKEYVSLVNSYHIVVGQLQQKNKIAESIKSEIQSQTAFTEKSRLQYQEKIDEINKLREDYAYYDEVNGRLFKLLDHTNALKEQENEFYQKLWNEKLKRSALTAEMDRPRNVHRLTLLQATNPELAKHYKYLMVLKNNLVETGKELEKVREEKERVQKELDKVQNQSSEGLTAKQVRAQMKVYEDDIRQKNETIRNMAMSLRRGTTSLDDTSLSLGKARESLSRRRGTTAHLRSRNLMSVMQENEDNYFITEVPIACVTSFGGGFMPRAPATARNSKRFSTNTQSGTFNENDLVRQTTKQQRGAVYRPFLPRMTQTRARSPPASARSFVQSIANN